MPSTSSQLSTRLVLISDTHGMHRDLVVPDGDVLVHAGDITPHGDPEGLRDFDAWLGELPHPHKVVIAGNHDFCFEKDLAASRRLITAATFLQDEAATLAGLTFYGSPWQPRFFDWAFNLPRGSALKDKWDRIPAGTDVLVTHGPPRCQGDRTRDGRQEGCDDLLAAVRRLRPRLHVFGHIHEAYGLTDDGQTQFANASSCTLGYQPTNPPLTVTLGTARLDVGDHPKTE